jgi:hypothetical protein
MSQNYQIFTKDTEVKGKSEGKCWCDANICVRQINSQNNLITEGADIVNFLIFFSYHCRTLNERNIFIW